MRGADGTARLWNLQGNELTRLNGHQGPIFQVAFSPDGNLIATSGADGTARLWDLSGHQLALMEGHQGSVWHVAFSPDGDLIATSGEDGTARLWDPSGQQLAVLEGHQGGVTQVAFSPDGDQIATSGGDGTTRIWALNGQQIAQFEGTGDFNADWTQIAVALPPDRMRENGVVKLWPVYTLDRIDDLLAAACHRLRPYLTHNPDLSDEDRALCEGR
ncbi:WD40 repeat domain-containing protein [Nodosilinea sp. P-1105]|nr:WD40 repeat domain-containing protein [Nodosilinea sp. P-1105]